MTGRSEYAIVFTLAAANFAQLSARISLSPLVPEFIDAFAVSKSEIGLALTLMWATYALLQYPSGVLGDRFGERRVVLVALATLSVGSLLVAGSVSFLVFAVAALTIGTSTGLYFTAGTSLLNRRFENTGRVLGLHTAGAALSGLATPIVVAVVATRFGWRTAALFPLALAAPILGLFMSTVPAMPPMKPETRLREQFKLRTVVVLFSRPDVAYTVLLAAAFSFSFQSFASFFPTFLVEFSELSSFSASVVFAVVFLLGAIALPSFGAASDIWSRDVVLAVPMGAVAVGYAVALGSTALAWLLVSAALLGTGLATGGVLQARLMDTLDASEQGSGFGLARTTYVLLGASGSVVTGTLADAAGWVVAYGFIVVLLVGAVGSLVFVHFAGLDL